MATSSDRLPKTFAAAMALSAIVTTRTGQPAQSVTDRLAGAGVFARIDAHVAQTMRQEGTPGLALGLTSRDGTLRVTTYGFADLAARVPVTPEHLFEIGSISKSFTAIALLQQREAGRFDPQAPIARYLPWFNIRSTYGPITGHHLLTHTAGIPRDRDDVPSSLYQAAGVRDRIAGAPPGSRYAYSNVGYQILGYALEAIAGAPYPEVIDRAVLRPLGMTASEASITHDTRLRLAVGYEPMYDDRPRHAAHPVVPATWLEYGAGDGSIASNADDMLAYVRMLLNRGALRQGRLISAESFDVLTAAAVKTGERSQYGYGLQIQDGDGGRRVIAHSGGMVGYHSVLLADVTAGIGVILLANGPGSSGVARFALDAARAGLDGRPLPDLPPVLSRGRVEQAADYAGTFTTPDGETLTLKADGERLLLQRVDRAVPLEPRGRDAFYVNDPDFALFLLRFERHAGAVVEAVHGARWYAGSQYTGPKTFEYPPAWSAYPGHYRTTHAWFSNFRIALRKGRLLLISPEGTEQVLVPLDGGEFTLDEKESAERLRFDTIVDGRALRVNLSGVDYYRSFTP